MNYLAPCICCSLVMVAGYLCGLTDGRRKQPRTLLATLTAKYVHRYCPHCAAPVPDSDAPWTTCPACGWHGRTTSCWKDLEGQRMAREVAEAMAILRATHCDAPLPPPTDNGNYLGKDSKHAQ